MYFNLFRSVHLTFVFQSFLTIVLTAVTVTCAGVCNETYQWRKANIQHGFNEFKYIVTIIRKTYIFIMLVCKLKSWRKHTILAIRNIRKHSGAVCRRPQRCQQFGHMYRGWYPLGSSPVWKRTPQSCLSFPRAAQTWSSIKYGTDHNNTKICCRNVYLFRDIKVTVFSSCLAKTLSWAVGVSLESLMTNSIYYCCWIVGFWLHLRRAEYLNYITIRCINYRSIRFPVINSYTKNMIMKLRLVKRTTHKGKRIPSK